MELWDLYDEERKPIGRTHVRGVPLETGEYHIVTDIWTVNHRMEVLLTQRHPDKTYGLQWECTGGSVLAGEDSESGALRELWEEVGLTIRREELCLMHTIRLQERFVDTYITYQKVTREQLRLQAAEVVDARFVSFDELIRMWNAGIVVPKSRFLLYKDQIKEFILSQSQPSSHDDD